MDNKYTGIVKHYEACLEKFGDSHLGVDWPNWDDAQSRYKVMLDIIKEKNGVSVLDFGCGTSHLLEYILRNKVDGIVYSGLDISDKFITIAKEKFPGITYHCLDILSSGESLPEFDYIIMNGVFTEKLDLSFEEMLNYFELTLKSVFQKVKVGLAFNVMSKNVDWERDDLFHLSFDVLAQILIKNLGRHFVIRHDYKLYEYTVYVYKSPNV